MVNVEKLMGILNLHFPLCYSLSFSPISNIFALSFAQLFRVEMIKFCAQKGVFLGQDWCDQKLSGCFAPRSPFFSPTRRGHGTP